MVDINWVSTTTIKLDSSWRAPMTDQAPQNPGAPVVTLEERERCTYGGSPTATWLRNSEEASAGTLAKPSKR